MKRVFYHRRTFNPKCIVNRYAIFPPSCQSVYGKGYAGAAHLDLRILGWTSGHEEMTSRQVRDPLWEPAHCIGCGNGCSHHRGSWRDSAVPGISYGQAILAEAIGTRILVPVIMGLLLLRGFRQDLPVWCYQPDVLRHHHSDRRYCRCFDQILMDWTLGRPFLG